MVCKKDDMLTDIEDLLHEVVRLGSAKGMASISSLRSDIFSPKRALTPTNSVASMSSSQFRILTCKESTDLKERTVMKMDFLVASRV